MSEDAGLPHDLPQAQQEIVQLRTALRSRACIDQAKGVLMAWLCCSPEEAFGHLVQLSQQRNRKVREIAEDVMQVTSSCEADRARWLTEHFGPSAAAS